MQATCVSACRPQPITPSEDAPSFARYFAATALPAPVRSRPRWSASITATSSGFVASNRTTTNEIGRASCRERVEISVVARALKKKKKNDTTLNEHRLSTDTSRRNKQEATD